MEAKDTVMTSEKMTEIAKKAYNANDGLVKNLFSFLIIEAIAQTQAKISFKAGYDKALAQLAGMTKECKQIGRKEVVEFINGHSSSGAMWSEATRSNQICLICPKYLWQAKLKEWEINDLGR